MNIIFNENALEIQAPNLLAVLEQKEVAGQKGIAVAVNNKVIPRSEWLVHQLHEGDKVLVITATKGG